MRLQLIWRRGQNLTAAFRRRWAGFLVALYIVAVHGLPAVHLGWHQGAHVHELGGLRWLRPLRVHTHDSAHAEHAPVAAAQSAAPRRVQPQRLRPAHDASIADLIQHAAAGPAHALSALLAPPQIASLLPVSSSSVRRFFHAARPGRTPRARAAARAPPQLA